MRVAPAMRVFAHHMKECSWWFQNKVIQVLILGGEVDGTTAILAAI